MPDEKMPPQPTTMQLPAMTDRALLEDLAREMRGARADIALVTNDMTLLRQRVSIIEGLRQEDEARLVKASTGVKQLSQSDGGQNMQIASIAVKVDALASQHDKLAESQAAQTRMLIEAGDQLKRFVATPAVKVIGGILFGIFSTWIANRFGIELPK